MKPTCKRHKSFAFATLVIALLPPSVSLAADILDLQVNVSQTAPAHSVIRFTLPKELQDGPHFALVRTDNQQSIPIQIDYSGPSPQAVWMLADELPAGQARTYGLTTSAPSYTLSSPVVSLKDDGKHLHMSFNDHPILTYNHALVDSPLDDQPYYARSGYIHPLYSPTGQIVTDDFNPDHAHQHGIMFAWRKMTFEGRSFDCWNQKAGLGRVEHLNINSIASGPVFAYFSTELQHVDLTAPNGPQPVLNEKWNAHIYAVQDFFLFDLESIQRCATDKPVTIDKIHYGGMMFRGSADWHCKTSYDYLTSDGKNKTDGNHSRPNWVDIGGAVTGHLTGVTIFDHTDNFRFPQPVRLHPKMPYFCFAPAVLDSFTIEPGKPYVSKYRYYVHQGSLNPNIANSLWQNYVHPASITVLAQ